MSMTRVLEPEQFQPTVLLLMNKCLHCWVLSILGHMGAFSVPPVEVVTPQMQSQVPGCGDIALCHLQRMEGFRPMGCGFMRMNGEEGIDLF